MKSDCAFYYAVKLGGKRKEACRALLIMHCEGCKFFKTKEEFSLIKERQDEYRYAHRNKVNK